MSVKRYPLALLYRKFATKKTKDVTVAVIGAAGGIGQPLSLLLKQSPLIKRLKLFDIVHVPGIVADLSHIETPTKVEGNVGADNLASAICGADIVVVSAGLPRKPGMSRDDLFKSNASIIQNIAEAVAENSPKALFAIITNPVNSTVPIAAQVLKNNGAYDPKRLFGISVLDVVRSNAFLAELKGLNPLKVEVPVIGGHSGATIIPLFSQCVPEVSLKKEEVAKLTKRVQNAGTEVVEAKAGAGSATLSMAYAAARFTISLVRAFKGEKNIVECAYVQSDVQPGTTFWASPILLGTNGLEKNLGIGDLNEFEEALLKPAVKELKESIKQGEDFVNDSEC